MKAYYVHYKLWSHDTVHGIQILANNRMDAYEKAVYETIPKLENTVPYSAWVHSVTYQNGNEKLFNTCEGLPY